MVGSFSRNFGPTTRAVCRLLFAFLLLLALSSSAMAAVLVVQVRTDLIPGTELGWVRSHFDEMADDGTTVKPQNAVMDRWLHFSASTNWATGVRVAESPRLPNALYRGKVSIYNPQGGLVLSRPIRVELASGIHVVTVLLSREPGVTPPQRGFLPGLETSHWTSEEFGDDPSDPDSTQSKDPIQCPVNLVMYGLGCNDDFCDNVRVHCRAMAGLSNSNFEWTPFFSDGPGTFEGCKTNEFATGLRCRGDFCDDISLRCTEHSATIESCYITDPISDNPPITDFRDATRGYVRRIQCQGNNCDDKRLEICSIVEVPLFLGHFSDLCVTSIGGSVVVGICQGADKGANTPQLWALDAQTGLIANPLTGTCLTAIGGSSSVTEENCAEAGDTNWFVDASGRLSSIDPNNQPLCLSVVGVQDPLGVPPLGAPFELGTCSDALYQSFEPGNAALPAPLPEIDVGMGEVFPLPMLRPPAWLLLIGVISTIGALTIRKRSAKYVGSHLELSAAGSMFCGSSASISSGRVTLGSRSKR